MKKGETLYKKNVSINVIYWGFQHLVWVIDKLGYDYMTDWRNQICQWMIDMEKKYNWVGKNQRSWGTCDCAQNISNKSEDKK